MCFFISWVLDHYNGLPAVEIHRQCLIYQKIVDHVQMTVIWLVFHHRHNIKDCKVNMQFGDSAVQYASYNGYMEAVKLLVEFHNADVTFVNQVWYLHAYSNVRCVAIDYSIYIIFQHSKCDPYQSIVMCCTAHGDNQMVLNDHQLYSVYIPYLQVIFTVTQLASAHTKFEYIASHI